ncbi:killer cell lectin-like receptor, subfamily A, member 17 isoform X2 [Rattus norvegicus]|uniref:killer cell lectin-like receptor, subfamily A, member 17 isoform X2 n=1 Tax=Rattus norvegicus TaxID=10116 RepID=UPI001916D4E5|nr:killer cell lectin-like receptor, subfamily A, member 17 isoform X2 [Rattus norvegicus]
MWEPLCGYRPGKVNSASNWETNTFQQNHFGIETQEISQGLHFNLKPTLYITPKMSEEEITYSTVRFKISSEVQNQVRPKEPQRTREAVHRVFQYTHAKHELPEETLSRINNGSTMQSDIDLKEEMLRNMSINCSQGNDLLQSLNREPKRWYSKIYTVKPSSQHTGKNVEIYWFCYGIKCYYFILDQKTWIQCKQACQKFRLSLLKIDDDDELKFLQLQVLSDSYWIGLSYYKTKKEWSWIDNGQSELSLNLKKYNVKDGDCMFLSKIRLENAKCMNPYPCICQKRLDKFPD